MIDLEFWELGAPKTRSSFKIKLNKTLYPACLSSIKNSANVNSDRGRLHFDLWVLESVRIGASYQMTTLIRSD